MITEIINGVISIGTALAGFFSAKARRRNAQRSRIQEQIRQATQEALGQQTAEMQQLQQELAAIEEHERTNYLIYGAVGILAVVLLIVALNRFGTRK